MVLRLLLWAVVGFLIYTALQTFRLGWRGSRRPPPAGPRDGEKLERDPQCGTFVPRREAVAATIHGREQWFCSNRCRDQFLQRL